MAKKGWPHPRSSTSKRLDFLHSSAHYDIRYGERRELKAPKIGWSSAMPCHTNKKEREPIKIDFMEKCKDSFQTTTKEGMPLSCFIIRFFPVKNNYPTLNRYSINFGIPLDFPKMSIFSEECIIVILNITNML